MAKPVFFDPLRKRWKRLRLALNIAGVLSTMVIVIFAISVFNGAKLPSAALPETRPQYRKLTDVERRHYRRTPVARRKSAKAPSQVQLNSGEGIRAAFYVTWDAGSFASLKEYAHQIDMLYPEWLHVLTPDGHIQAVSTTDGTMFPIVENGKAVPVDPQVMDFLKQEKLPMEVFPMVNNFDPRRNADNWIPNIGEMFQNPASRSRFRAEMMTFLGSDAKYRGLTIDFEGFPGSAQPGYRALLGELNDDLHARGMKLYVSVPASDPDFDFPFVAAHSDGLIIMDYDEHYMEGEPGPVASQDWFIKNLQRAIKLVPKDKIICSIANYGYDWPVSKAGKVLPGVATLNDQEAWLHAAESEADVELDTDSLNPHYTYVDDATGNRHEVWFTDAVSALNQMRAARALGITTFAVWRLGAEDRSLWKIWDNPSDPNAVVDLKEVPPGHDVDHENFGEIMRIEQHPTAGERTAKLDPQSDLITEETYTKLPLPYQLAHYGAQKKEIAISFDDGPDPDFTPKMLDILKKYNAPATFFVIGEQADRFPSILKRMYREGHEIGNHSFTHPDIADISKRAMRLELNATERLFEAKLGVKPLYFRPPYSIDQDPEIDDDVRPLEVMQEMGYIAVGAKLDPHDWDPQLFDVQLNADRPRNADDIVKLVLDNLPPCQETNQACGNIILLHDGGGNRAESVKALPRIIEGVRARGFQIVPVSRLMGKTRDEIMPAIAPNERWSAWVDSIGFTAWGSIREGIALLFFVGDVLMSLRLFLVGALAIFDRFHKRHRDRETAEHFRPAVAVLIPAYNEEKVIVQTIRSALDSDYPNLRVIVIDDGSKDRTYEIAENSFQAEIASGKVTVLTKENAGKAEALNYGLQFTTEEIFVGIDADTMIAPGAISYLVPHFLDERVAAVAGNAKVGNRVNVWTRWQALEYVTSQNFERRALNTLSAVTVVPGALGAWRTSLVRDAGGYHIDTVAEDADLTMALLKSGFRIEYEDRALAYTEAPISARGLMRQRFRWSFGILQSLWKHREVFGRKGVLGYVALPNILIFQILLPLVSPFIDIMFAFGVVNYFIDKRFHPSSADPTSLHKLVVFFLAFLIIDFLTSAIAFALERRSADEREDVLLLLDVWLQRFAYRQLFSVVLFRTLKRAFEGKPFAWDKLDRTAKMTYAAAPPATRK